MNSQSIDPGPDEADTWERDMQCNLRSCHPYRSHISECALCVSLDGGQSRLPPPTHPPQEATHVRASVIHPSNSNGSSFSFFFLLKPSIKKTEFVFLENYSSSKMRNPSPFYLGGTHLSMAKSVFFSPSPLSLSLSRPFSVCPRCQKGKRGIGKKKKKGRLLSCSHLCEGLRWDF